MLNFLIIYHYNISLQCNSGQQKDAENIMVRYGHDDEKM